MEIIKNKELQKNLAQKVKDKKLEELKDIEGIDSLEWMPLAPGWWFLIIIVTALLLRAIIKFFLWLKYKLSYQGRVFQELSLLQSKLTTKNASETARKLAKIIRQLAIYEHSHLKCASLIGESWLKWLKDNDKYKFDWEKDGTILTGAIYAPPTANLIALADLNKIIEATKKWVEKC